MCSVIRFLGDVHCMMGINFLSLRLQFDVVVGTKQVVDVFKSATFLHLDYAGNIDGLIRASWLHTFHDVFELFVRVGGRRKFVLQVAYTEILFLLCRRLPAQIGSRVGSPVLDGNISMVAVGHDRRWSLNIGLEVLTVVHGLRADAARRICSEV